MTRVTTATSEFGAAAAEAVLEVTGRAVGGQAIATYIEKAPPLRWASIAEAGWDLVGIDEGDDEGATLRDLAAVAQVWGENPVQLPLVPTIIAKRHVAAAAEFDGPVSFAVPTQRSAPGHGVLPYGQTEGMAVVVDFATGELADGVAGRPDDYDYVMRNSTVDTVTRFTPVVARELNVLWAAECVGSAKRTVRDAVEFTKQREQFGRPIGSFQAVKHHLANAHIALELAETAAIWASLDEEAAQRAVAASFRHSVRAIELALQVHGGLGFTWEMGVHFALRHVVTVRELAAGVAAHA